MPARGRSAAIVRVADFVTARAGAQKVVNLQYPLTGLQWVSTPKPLQAAGDRLHLTANTSSDMFGFSHYTWSFTFAAAS